jgi:formylglycine-generating enzyme required for sulfatase activity
VRRRWVGTAAAAGLALAALGSARGAPAPDGGLLHGDALAAPPDAAVNSIGMRMVLVPAGTFVMGSPAGTPMRQDEETQRRVTLTRAFRIAATEVTQRQWLALMPTSRSPQKGDELPATSMSWTEAREFCERLSAREGASYRLPTEAEWEYACRAGGDGIPAAGEREEVAWFAADADGSAHPVGEKKPNAWGLVDMLGNVAEWTLDAYAPYPRLDEERDPRGPVDGSSRVVRGGSWRSFPPALRCAARASAGAAYQLSHVGLRVVEETEPPPAR